jgi:hypothetical protein
MRTPILEGTSIGEQNYFMAHCNKKEILTFANYAGNLSVMTYCIIYILTFACETPFVLAPNQPECTA